MSRLRSDYKTKLMPDEFVKATRHEEDEMPVLNTFLAQSENPPVQKRRPGSCPCCEQGMHRFQKCEKFIAFKCRDRSTKKDSNV